MNGPMHLFSDRLRLAGYDPSRVKLLRHNADALSAWNDSPDHFLSYASIQRADRSPFARDPHIIAHFLPGPQLPNGGFSAVFAGMTQLHGRWPWNDNRLPRVWLKQYFDPAYGHPTEAADQSWLPSHEALPIGLEIDWGHSPRSWHQWGDRTKVVIGQSKPDTLSAVSAPSAHSAEFLHAETLKYEERNLEQAIRRNSHALVRAAEEYRAGLIRIRPEQGRFRAALLERHGANCAMTGPCPAEALEAAHIIPFAEGFSDRDLPSNGLMLRRDIHRLFDLGLIGISPDSLEIMLAPSLRGDGPYQKLEASLLEADVSHAALTWHFANIFAGSPNRSCDA